MARIKEPENFVKMNEVIREYGGMYANWKSSGCKGNPPYELLEKLIEMHAVIDAFLISYKEKI